MDFHFFNIYNRLTACHSFFKHFVQVFDCKLTITDPTLDSTELVF